MTESLGMAVHKKLMHKVLTIWNPYVQGQPRTVMLKITKHTIAKHRNQMQDLLRPSQLIIQCETVNTFSLDMVHSLGLNHCPDTPLYKPTHFLQRIASQGRKQQACSTDAINRDSPADRPTQRIGLGCSFAAPTKTKNTTHERKALI